MVTGIDSFKEWFRAVKNNDVFRLTELIDPTAKIVAPQGVYADIQEFVQRMKNENVDIKQLGGGWQNKGEDSGRIESNV